RHVTLHHEFAENWALEKAEFNSQYRLVRLRHSLGSLAASNHPNATGMPRKWDIAVPKSLEIESD
ncbi:MAG TPA: hypothetical protein VG860_12995, partial [Terriglobia bacterium]|nr:hypothetical protein [Terriglobia bacterium]